MTGRPFSGTVAFMVTTEMNDSLRAALVGTRDEASERLAVVRSELARLQPEAQALENVIASVDAALAMAEPNGNTNSEAEPFELKPVPPDLPKGKAAAREALKLYPNVTMTVDQVASLMVENGWAEPSDRLNDTVRTNLLRAEGSYKDVHKVGRGLYSFAPPDPSDEAPDPFDLF